MAKVKFDPKTARKTFVKEWRVYRELTLEAVAEQLRVTAGAISQLETRRTAYTQPVLEGLARIYQCEPADLLSRPPGADETLATVWSSIPLAARPKALNVLKALSEKD